MSIDTLKTMTYEVTGPFRGARPTAAPPAPPAPEAAPAPVGPAFTGGRARPFGEVGEAFRTARRAGHRR